MIPAVIDVFGAMLVFIAALAITFEKRIYNAICGRCSRRNLEEDEEDVVITEEEEEDEE